MGGDEFCALFEPGGQVIEPIITRAPPTRCPSTARGSRSAAHTAPSSCRWRPTTRPTPCAWPTGACTRGTSTATGRRPAARARTCWCGRWPSATPTCPATCTMWRGLAEQHVPQARAQRRRGGQRGRHAAELHDVGKVAVPDDILSKPGPLERGGVRVHTPPHAHRRADHLRRPRPQRGRPAGPVEPRERWDGGGSCTPTGWAGEEDPAGVPHRLRRRRVRRDDLHPPLQPAAVGAAIRELRACAGTQFDPVVVEAFPCRVARPCSVALCLRAAGLEPRAGGARRAATLSRGGGLRMPKRATTVRPWLRPPGEVVTTPSPKSCQPEWRMLRRCARLPSQAESSCLGVAVDFEE